MKTVNHTLAACFVLFATLQYNDPDPWLWIPIYLYAATACILAAHDRAPNILLTLGILFCLAYAGLLLFIPEGVIDWANRHQAENLVQTMKASKPWIENTREFGGLLIVCTALGWNRYRQADR